MVHESWLQRWRDGNINFHRTEVHGGLARQWQARGRSVLVPLCGKSVDLRWLAERGHVVIGVELAERAVNDFFVEQRLTFDRRDAVLPAFVARELPITIYCGDYFRLQIPPCEALYDRAALVALPPSQRSAYAAHTDTLLQAEAGRLVISFEYDQSRIDGPPFSVAAEEVLGYWPELEAVERREVLEEAPPKFASVGITSVTEVIWRSPAPV